MQGNMLPQRINDELFPCEIAQTLWASCALAHSHSVLGVQSVPEKLFFKYGGVLQGDVNA